MTRPEGCKCDFRTYMVGDGCPYCNPDLYAWYAEQLANTPTPDAPEPMDGAPTFRGQHEETK